MVKLHSFFFFSLVVILIVNDTGSIVVVGLFSVAVGFFLFVLVFRLLSNQFKWFLLCLDAELWL